MKRPPPPLNLIRSFESAARHLSFTRAAEELGYTQAAISTHIRALEKYIGRDLFYRSARSLSLTEIGEAFLPTLRPALTQIDSATEAIVSGVQKRSVIIACPMSLAECWLPAAIDSFSETNPEVEVLIHGTIWDHAADEFADIVLSVLREDEVPTDARPLRREELVLVASPRLAEDLKSPADLAKARRILVSGRQEYWAAMSEALGLDAPLRSATVKTNASSISLAMAAAGQGVTIGLSTLAERYLRSGELVEPYPVRAPSKWSYHVTKAPSARDRLPFAVMRHLLEFAERE